MYLRQTFAILVLLLLVSANNVFAVCSGVYFKRTKTQQLSKPLSSTTYIDLDNDGIKDLLGFSDAGLAFYKGLANGFSPTPVLTNDGSDYFLVINKNAIADFNNDGLPDLIGQTYGPSPNLAIYLNNGNGGFTRSTVTLNTGASGETGVIYAADLNADGRTDVITKTAYDSPVYYRLADAANHFGPPVQLGFEDIRNIFVKDINNDGKNDLIYTEEVNFVEYIKFQFNQGNGTFAGPGRQIKDPIHYGNALIAADLNNDGKAEIISQAYYDTQNPLNGRYFFSVFGYNAKADGITETVVEITSVLTRTLAETQGFSNTPHASDFDGDGVTDLMFFSYGSGAVMAKNNGAINFSLRRFATVADYTPFLSELNGDSKTDLVTINKNSVTPYNSSVSLKQNVCEPQGQTRMVDFDGNGQSDLAFWRPSDGLWSFYSGQGYTGFNGNVNWGSGALGDIPVPQDYDGDGYTDFAVFRTTTGYWYIYQSSDAQTVIAQFGEPGDKPVPADFDGDGRADLAFFRPTKGTWAYQPSTAPGKRIGTRWGTNGDMPIPMDYDGDGMADIAVYRPSTGGWFVLRSSDNSTFSTIFGGTPGDRPMPADYDDDGIADFVIWRPNGAQNGINWFLATAHNLWGIKLGVPGDIAFPSVTTAARPTIYRPGNSLVFLTESSGFPVNQAGNRNVSWILPLD